jgi:hypothetical protein
MRYKLGLFHASNEKFIVSAKPVDSSNLPILAFFGNHSDFIDTLQTLNIDPEQHAELVYAAKRAIDDPEVGVCCEHVDLEPEQFRFLLSDHQHRLVA